MNSLDLLRNTITQLKSKKSSNQDCWDIGCYTGDQLYAAAPKSIDELQNGLYDSNKYIVVLSAFYLATLHLLGQNAIKTAPIIKKYTFSHSSKLVRFAGISAYVNIVGSSESKHLLPEAPEIQEMARKIFDKEYQRKVMTATLISVANGLD